MKLLVSLGTLIAGITTLLLVMGADARHSSIPASAPTYTEGGDANDSRSGSNVNRRGDTYQGKSAVWWARRAVQARKDANARGRTIRRLQAVTRRASGHFFDWLAAADCVHQHEASWTDSGAPYYGGMQADISFQRAYAPDHLNRWGTANHWPWWAQLEMAYRGWLFRGWAPWPATSRMCGLR